MDARTARQAIQAVVRRLQQAVSCVSPAVVNYALHAPDTYGVALRGLGPDKRFAHLSDGSGLGLAARYRLSKTPDGHIWTATLAAYLYGLSDRDGHEVVSYHWHPDARGYIKTPHLHLGVGAAAWRPDLARAHLPTGHVTLEDVLLLAIQELGVEPLRGDWHAILTRDRGDHL